MDEKIVDLLRGIGLGKVEIDVYLDLLKSKPSTATEIAKRIKYHRPNVYDALKRLTHRGFIKESVDIGKRLFHANPPSVIVSYIQQKKSEVQDIVPLLESMSNSMTETQNVSVSYGITRVREALNKILDFRREILVWGIPLGIEELVGRAFIEEAVKERIKRKIPTKVLYSGWGKEVISAAKVPLQEVRYLRNRDKPNATTLISGNYVLILVYVNTSLMVIEMKGQQIAGWFTDQFYSLWKGAEKPILTTEKLKEAYSLFKNVVKKYTLFLKKIVRKLSSFKKSFKKK